MAAHICTYLIYMKYIICCVFLENRLICSLVSRVAVEEQNLRIGFPNCFWGFWNWPSNLTRFNDTNIYVSNSKESIDGTLCDMAIEICKISSLDNPKQAHRRTTNLCHCVYDTFNHFVKLANIMGLMDCS
jgi:hypothetical protein